MMKFTLKFTLKFFKIGLFALLTSAILAFLTLKFMPPEKLKAIVITLTESVSGRNLSIERLEVNFGLNLTLKANGITISQARHSKAPPMLRVQNLTANLKWWQWLLGKADITATVSGARMLIRRESDGSSKRWFAEATPSVMQSATPSAKPSADMPAITATIFQSILSLVKLKKIELKNIKVKILTPNDSEKPLHNTIDNHLDIEQLLIETAHKNTTVTLAAKISAVKSLLHFAAISTPLNLPANAEVSVKIHSEMHGDLGSFFANNHSANHSTFDILLKDKGLSAQANGTIIDMAMGINGMEINKALSALIIAAEFNLQADSTAIIADLINRPLPELGAISASGEFSSNRGDHDDDEKLSLKNLIAHWGTENNGLSLSGSVDNLITLSGVQGRLNYIAESTTELSQYTDYKIPDFGAVMFTANVSKNADKFILSEIDAKIGTDNLMLVATGEIKNLTEFEQISLNVEGFLDDLKPAQINKISALFDSLGFAIKSRAIPETVRFKGEIKDEIGGDLVGGLVGGLVGMRLENIDMAVEAAGMQATVQGSLSNLSTLDNINLNLQSNFTNWHYLEGVFAEGFSDAPDDFAPLELTAVIKSSGSAADSLTNLNLFAQGDGLNLTVEGNVDNLFNPEHHTLKMSGSIDKISRLNNLIGGNLSADVPLSIHGEINLESGKYTLKNFETKIGNESIFGSLEIFKVPATKNDSDNIIVRGDFNIAHFDLTPYFLANLDTPENKLVSDEDTAWELPDTTGKKIFSSKPLPLEMMRKMDAEIEINARRLVFHNTDMRNAKIALTLKNGELNGALNIAPIAENSSVNSVNADVYVDASSDLPALNFDLFLHEFPTPIVGGTTNLNINLDGNGQSIAEIMANLNGNATLVVREAMVKKSSITPGSGRLIFNDDSKQTELECGFIRMKITDGVADFEKNIAAQFTDVTWIGGGSVNLDNEKVKIKIAPKSRKGILSGSNLLAKIVTIGGTIRNSRIVLNPLDVALTYGKYLAYFSTGGLSLLAESLYDAAHANSDVCKNILAESIIN